MSILAQFLLRFGLAFAFLYSAVSGFLEPDLWVGFLPSFLLPLGLAPELALQILGAAEIILALWLLWGRYLEIAGLLAFLFLAGIVIFNLSQMAIVFRDMALAAAALALAVDARQNRQP